MLARRSLLKPSGMQAAGEDLGLLLPCQLRAAVRALCHTAAGAQLVHTPSLGAADAGSIVWKRLLCRWLQ
eukprot:1161061-Pelagomonas_calceolata.AAC.4